ncbi:MAG: GNAT family N-acetyltransferase [Chloroflexota bacterium]
MENPERAVGGIAVRTPPDVELRPLGRDDLRMAVAMARELHGHPPLDDAEAFRSRLAALINSVDVAPFLAVEAGQPVGLGILQFRRRLNFATFEGWVSELYVTEAARGRGIGRALLGALVAEWRLRGSHRLQANVPDGSAAAALLLTVAGFEEWMLDFRLRPIHAPPVTMPDGVSLRPVREDDEEPVTRLLAEFGAARTPAPERAEAVLRTFADHLRRVADGSLASTVAELDGELVGVCSLEWQQPFWTDETHTWVADLLVTEHARGSGIGRALLASALRTAEDRGAAQVSLETGHTRLAAHGLYRSMGFAESGRTYLLRQQATS